MSTGVINPTDNRSFILVHSVVYRCYGGEIFCEECVFSMHSEKNTHETQNKCYEQRKALDDR